MTDDRFRKEKISEIMACPSCLGDLQEKSGSDQLECAGCGMIFPVSRQGIPVLFTPEHQKRINSILGNQGKKMVQEYTSIGKGIRKYIKYIKPPELLLPLEPDPQSTEMDFFYNSEGTPKIVLNVGGGPLRHRNKDINLNIGLFPNVDMLGDAHTLPVKTGSVDAVMCKAVLEHVENPMKVLSELDRVLKPGGFIYIDVPFLFIAHGYPQDFFRFTRSAVDILMGDYEKIKSGASIGPFSTLMLLFNDFILEVTGQRNRIGGKILSGGLRLFLFWLKYLDPYFIKKTDCPDFSGAYYFVGRKK